MTSAAPTAVVDRLTSDQKGSIAESAIVHAAIKLGIGVFRPLTDGERYDLIFDLRPTLVRVQCKWAPLHGDVVVVRSYSARRTATGLRRRPYTAQEIDAVAAYCHQLDRCFYLPAEVVVGRKQVGLRVGPSRNNQHQRVNWADAYALEALPLGRLGP